MAILGEAGVEKPDLRGYETNSLFGVAKDYLAMVRGINEATGCDIIRRPADLIHDEQAKDELKNSFIEQSYDENDPRFQDEGFRESHLENMEQLFDNDMASMNEAAALGAYNPVVGMTLPMHKNILMNAVFDQVLPKDVARSPKFTLTMETRTIVDIHGNEYDMFAEQNKISSSIEESVPTADIVVTAFTGRVVPVAVLGADGKAKAGVTIPRTPTGDLVTDCFNDVVEYGAGNKANLSIDTYINKLLVTGYAKKGDAVYVDGAIKTVDGTTVTEGENTLVFNVSAKFVPGYGANTSQMNERIAVRVPLTALGVAGVAGTDYKIYSVNINGQRTPHNGIELLMSQPLDITNKAVAPTVVSTNPVKGVIIHAKVDVSSAAFPTVSLKWSAQTKFFEIPEAPHITVPISPEEVKDIQALYDVNQVTKLMSMMKLALLHWKDDKILADLDDSFLGLPETDKVTGAFDFAPPLNYNQDPITWRRAMFMDNFSQYATRMLQVLNDENMTFAIFGRPDLIRRIAPVDYTYQTPSNIGPVQLDFKRTVVSSDHRVYNFVSTQKMRNNNNLIVLLIPRNSMRITYKIIDYQLYVSNEIRDSQQYQLPAITCFERWLFLQYQPVQGRIHILNPSGLRENIQMSSENDYIGERGARNDYTSNTKQYASETNGVIDPATGNMKVPPVTVK